MRKIPPLAIGFVLAVVCVTTLMSHASAGALSCYLLTSNLPEKNLKATVDPDTGDFELKSTVSGIYLSVDSRDIENGVSVWRRTDCTVVKTSFDPNEFNYKVTCNNALGYLSAYYRINKAMSSGTAYAFVDGKNIFEAKLEYCR